MEQGQIDFIDNKRMRVSARLDPKEKQKLGQYFTPANIAIFMASLFKSRISGHIHLLDPGAGIGSLSAAFIERWAKKEFGSSLLSLTAYEIDEIIKTELSSVLNSYKMENREFNFEINGTDFIEDSINKLQFGGLKKFTHVILNPPYAKIHSRSKHRRLLRAVGIETVNLYTGFVALAVLQLEMDGELIAIIPRSFCNGLYYKPFRQFILSRTSIKHIHLFGSRDKAFKDDAVLQENIIIHLIRSTKQEEVRISTSTDDSFSDYSFLDFPFERIVKSDDLEKYIHIPATSGKTIIELSNNTHFLLPDLGLTVSTGPVVDFRVKSHLRNNADNETVPLLYPGHFHNFEIHWPNYALGKPNHIKVNQSTRKWLYPNGYYVLVRRFSSKEEKRRIVASVVNPDSFSSDSLGFENHLNVFHSNKHGLSPDMAYGLAIYLNSSIVDDYFRNFSGHTQVNATDLRSMKYPNTEILTRLGSWAKSQIPISQSSIDEKIRSVL